ncbi:MAG TPA: A/G-specific adenine glycosylase [Chitinophagaceae bacterium]|nr:A/G-specific adenine glycosylase [Chitinophagaceae bacterium]
MKKRNSKAQEKRFPRLLLKWNEEKNKRQMPWKGERDPYKIWLSEIILQQTRVGQGLAYYHRFIETFPTIQQLAKASDEKIYKCWEGLGYYTRCRNLIKTARYIVKEHKGKFPSTYPEILELAGVGPYTAAAIASFAFNQPHAVVDGNVFRVLARVFGISQPTDSSAGKKFFTALADKLLDKDKPGIYNQALMDFGAVICKPVNPLCNACPFNKTCSAFLNNKINELPVKEKKLIIKKRWFYFLVMEFDKKIAIQKREEKDIWQQLFTFPLIESKIETTKKQILSAAEKRKWLIKNKYETLGISPVLQQQLTHQLIKSRFIHVRVRQKPTIKNNWRWVPQKTLEHYAFPKLMDDYRRLLRS